MGTVVFLLSCLCILAQQSSTSDDEQLVVKANGLLKDGSLEEAKKDIQQAIKLNVTNYLAYAVAAKIASKQGDSDEATNFIQKALELAPDEDKDKVRALAEQIQLASSSSLPTKSDKLSDEDRLTLNELMLLLDQADQATTPEDRDKAFSDFLSRSTAFAEAHPDETNIWVMRAFTAIDLNRPHDAWEAGQHLKALGLMHSDDPKVGKIFGELDLNGWQDKEPENIEKMYGDGYNMFKFGMSPSQVASAANINVNTEWENLPVASEYSGLDVRYFWQYLKDNQNLSQINDGKYSGSSYVCFMFKDEKLFKISIRFINDNEYQSYKSLFDRELGETGATVQNIQSTEFFHVDSPKVMLYATFAPWGTVLDVVKSGSPLSSGSASDNVDLPTSSNSEAQRGYYYTIMPGNTLSAIAKAYQTHGINVTVVEILRANPNLSPYNLVVGEKIFIPDNPD